MPGSLKSMCIAAKFVQQALVQHYCSERACNNQLEPSLRTAPLQGHNFLRTQSSAKDLHLIELAGKPVTTGITAQVYRSDIVGQRDVVKMSYVRCRSSEELTSSSGNIDNASFDHNVVM